MGWGGVIIFYAMNIQTAPISLSLVGPPIPTVPPLPAIEHEVP